MYISIYSKMLFLLFLISSSYGFKRKINTKFLKNVIFYEQDDWNHGEVEWEFTDKYYINKFNISYKEINYKIQNKTIIIKKKNQIIFMRFILLY